MTQISAERNTANPDDHENAGPLSRNRNFQLLWSSQFLSTIGTRTSRLSYPLLVLAVFGSAADASIVSAALTLPMPLLYLVAGALVDRCGHKRILLLCEIVRAAALGSLAIAIFRGSVHLPQLIVVAFLEGSCFVFFQITEAALIPRTVARNQLPSAIAANQARSSAAELVGQPLGGLLFGLGWAVPFFADATSYLVSFTALLRLRLLVNPHHTRTADHRDRPSLRHDFLVGLRWFLRQRELVALAVFIGLVNLLFTALPLVMIVQAKDHGATPGVIGWMFATLTCGAIAGTLLAPRLNRRVHQRLYLCASPWFWSVCILALAMTSRPLLLGCAVGAAMLAAPTFNVITSTYWYRVTPNELQARSHSVLRLLSWGTLPLGSLTAGWLTHSTTTATAFTVLAAAMALVATGALIGAVLWRRTTRLSSSPLIRHR
jgi:MFS family permease